MKKIIKKNNLGYIPFIIVMAIFVVTVIFTAKVLYIIIEESAIKSYRNNFIETEEVTIVATATAAEIVTISPEPIKEILLLDDFDSKYVNTVDINSQIVASGDRIFYVVNDRLYGYDINEEETIFSQKILTGANNQGYVFESKGYIYYQIDNDIYRINAETLKK